MNQPLPVISADSVSFPPAFQCKTIVNACTRTLKDKMFLSYPNARDGGRGMGLGECKRSLRITTFDIAEERMEKMR